MFGAARFRSRQFLIARGIQWPWLIARYHGIYRRFGFGPCVLWRNQHNVKSGCCFRGLGQVGTAQSHQESEAEQHRFINSLRPLREM